MKFHPKFYRCEHCGQIISVINDEGISIICCGQEMTRLEPNTADAAGEKHVPVTAIDGDTLTVKAGSAAHPMTGEHHIEWIYLLMDNGGQRRILEHTGAPEARFDISQGNPVRVYAYCNLHGLWSNDVQR